jgi:ketosteroid isomerase-like protein
MTNTPSSGHDSAFEAIFRRALQGLADKDIAGWVSMFAEDGAMEFPFAVPGAPPRISGRDTIRDFMRDYPKKVEIATYDVEVFHHTADPNIVIVEFSIEGRALETGRAYSMRYIGVVTLRGGEIINYRDYYNPLAAAAALGGVDAVAALYNRAVS